MRPALSSSQKGYLSNNLIAGNAIMRRGDQPKTGAIDIHDSHGVPGGPSWIPEVLRQI